MSRFYNLCAYYLAQVLAVVFAIVFSGPGLGVPDEAAALGRRQLDSAGVKPNLVKTETKKRTEKDSNPARQKRNGGKAKVNHDCENTQTAHWQKVHRRKFLPIRF